MWLYKASLSVSTVWINIPNLADHKHLKDKRLQKLTVKDDIYATDIYFNIGSASEHMHHLTV